MGYVCLLVGLCDTAAKKKGLLRRQLLRQPEERAGALEKLEWYSIEHELKPPMKTMKSIEKSR